jgi:hypothetical protein
MNKKAWLFCIGSLIVGLVIGCFAELIWAGGTIANTIACLEMTSVGEMENRAFQAYLHESAPVAIYALTQALNKEKEAEQLGGTPFMSKQIISVDLLLTHARLAKLYAQTGQTNLSSQHFEEALNYAKTEGKLQTITNQAALLDFVAKIDKGVKK